MSKRDDDSPQSDMEVGMTTAERRRRRRRGGGLRVPSDNVPRRTTPPVVAPVPEDPSLAMSIAYSFSSDGSEPVRTTSEQAVPGFADPVAPEAMATLPTVMESVLDPVLDPVIDPPSAPVEQADFEMKTREMTAVDLEALGLKDPASSGRMAAAPAEAPGEPASARDDAPEPVAAMSAAPVAVAASSEPSGANPRASGAFPVVTMASGPVPVPVVPSASGPLVVAEPPAPAPHRPRERLQTVALSDEDLEEMREAVARAQSTPVVAPSPEPAPAPDESPAPVSELGAPRRALGVNATQPLSVLDIEVEERPVEGSVPEIDINELAERADSSGEYVVDIEDPEETTPPPAVAPDERRGRPPSVPPATPATVAAPTAAPAAPAVSTPAAPPPTAAPPPPPPAAHKAPPTPPPKAKAASTPAKAPEGKGARTKAWFVDLFDEDYLRTLPFLTPQATQHEAEFVIDAMGLAPGAQLLDVGCGYGRHAMELAARGFHVVGTDLSAPLLARGAEEATRRGLEINFVRDDMRELALETQFDGAYCLFSTFGYFDDETNKKTLVNIARTLRPGGRLILEILNRDYVIADLPTRVWWEGDGCVVLEEIELNYFSSRIQVNRSVVFDDGRQLEQEISVRAYSLHEVGKLMHAAGFRVLEVSGGYHTRGRFFGNQSRHIIVLAERKEATVG